MEQTKAKTSHNRHVKTLIIAGIIVLFAILFMYFQDRQQERNLRLHRLEARMELLENWGRTQGPQNNLPPGTGGWTS